MQEHERKFKTSYDLCKYIADNNENVFVSFSYGKDSIASVLQLKKYFKPENIHLAFYYIVPELEFQQKNIKYYEEVFETKIQLFPSPAYYKMLTFLTFQNLTNTSIIEEMEIFKWLPTYDEILGMAKLDKGFSIETITAVGVRQADSINRRITISQHGSYNTVRQQFYPIFDWSTKKVFEEIENAGILLPIDYEIWGRTFDGLYWNFIKGLKEYFPNDYQKIKAFFPLIDIEETKILNDLKTGRAIFELKDKEPEKVFPEWVHNYKAINKL